MLPDEQREHMISEANALEISKKICGIIDHTDRSKFTAVAKYRKLQLEVHPDKSGALCDRHKITQLHKVIISSSRLLQPYQWYTNL